MTTDTTHITKEALLQAIEEQRGLALLDGYKPTQLDNILARAAELSAQESKPEHLELSPEHLELSEVVYAAGDTDDAFIWPVDWGDPVECEGFVILRGDPKLREWIKHQLDHARQNMADAVAFIRSQDASPKDGWRPIESAPKDGTLILLGHVDPYWPMRCRRWHEDHWRGHDGIEATHWQPLPEPPK